MIFRLHFSKDIYKEREHLYIRKKGSIKREKLVHFWLTWEFQILAKSENISCII